jgi:hypothetical protein
LAIRDQNRAERSTPGLSKDDPREIDASAAVPALGLAVLKSLPSSSRDAELANQQWHVRRVRSQSDGFSPPEPSRFALPMSLRRSSKLSGRSQIAS